MNNLFGEPIVGSITQQLEITQDAHNCKNGADLFRAWALEKFPDLNEYQLRDIIKADRQAREYFN